MANTYATRTFGTPTHVHKYTISFWVKRSRLGIDHIAPITAGTYNSTNMGQFLFSGNDNLLCQTYNAGATLKMARDTNMKFRDTNAWYHIVLGVDGTLATAADRQKLYVNGEQITSFDASTNVDQNTDMAWNQSGIQCMIGNRAGMSYYFDGYLSHIHFIDGTQYAASDFGSTDATTGEWKINTTPSVTYGNNGFFILKDGNSLTDQSGNSNNFTLGGGTLTKSEDNPSNVFATWNILDSHYFWGATESSWATNGNTKARSGNSQYSASTATMGASSGKYYWEIKAAAASNSEKYYHIGIKSKQDTNTSTALGVLSTDYCYRGHNGNSQNNNTSSTFGATYQVGDIVGVALDLDNNKLYFSKNGTWQNSGDPTSGSTGTGAISITDPASTDFGFYMPAWSWNDGSSYGTIEANFGNGYFGTTAVSSAGTNASGNGVFEYDVPTGYTALSTKGLNE